MKMKKNLIFILFVFGTLLFGQNITPLRFIDCESVNSELRKTSDKIQIIEKYNWEHVLLLDTTELKTIKKISPNTIEEYKKLLFDPTQKKAFNCYQTKQTDIKTIFIDRESQTELLNFLYPNQKMYVYFPIYIKSNKAVFEIYTNTWSAAYFAKLENGEFCVVKLYEIIE
jgi:hypothetical protein